MANKEHVKIALRGAVDWNKWRADNPNIRPDLSQAKLFNHVLSSANMKNADLNGRTCN